MKACVRRVLCCIVMVGLLATHALAAPITFTAPQQESINKISARGGLVMQLANDTDALVVNLSLGGKQITDAEVAEIKNLPKIAQLNLANTAVTDAGLGAVVLVLLHRVRAITAGRDGNPVLGCGAATSAASVQATRTPPPQERGPRRRPQAHLGLFHKWPRSSGAVGYRYPSSFINIMCAESRNRTNMMIRFIPDFA